MVHGSGIVGPVDDRHIEITEEFELEFFANFVEVGVHEIETRSKT